MAKGRDDLRLALGWVDHLKTRRLIDEVGERGALCLLRLWAYAAQNHPDGVLASREDVELAAGWRGRRGVLLEALVRLRWLEADGVTLHDWQEEQPWIVGKGRRVAAAKASAAARWHKGGDAVAPNPQCGPHSGSEDSAMPNREKGNAPIPTPIPSPTRTPERTHDPDRGYATTTSSPQVEPPPTGRSFRLAHDRPAPRSAVELAEQLRKKTICGLKEAVLVMESLLEDGADPAWIYARIMDTADTPKPWDWGKSAKRAWADSTGVGADIA